MLFEISAEHFQECLTGEHRTIKRPDPLITIDRTDFFLVVDDDKKIIRVTGVHSEDEDWPDNFDMRIRSFENCRDTDELWFSGIHVHAGFLRQYKAVRNKLLDICYEKPDYAIRGDGFSLGAAWGQLFIQDCLHRWPERDIKAIYYAPPNPWRRLPRNYQEMLNNAITFVIPRWDVVTWMRVLAFRRYGKETRIGKPWRLLPKQHRPAQIIRALLELDK